MVSGRNFLGDGIPLPLRVWRPVGCVCPCVFDAVDEKISLSLKSGYEDRVQIQI